MIKMLPGVVKINCRISQVTLIPLLVQFSRFLLLGQLLLGYSAAFGQQPAIERGQEILLPFKQQLMQSLQEGMQKSPVVALDVCRIKAPSIASDVSSNGIRVGRSSHKLRNQANQPPEWVRPVMQDYLENADDREPRVVTLDDGSNGYIEAIILQPQCTACHGDNISRPVLDLLSEYYPQDQATGFAIGELRGVFWVQFPAE